MNEMELLQWMNRLQLKKSLFALVDQHYFKYMLFVKLTGGSGLKPEDATECECDFDDRSLTIVLTFDDNINVPHLTQLVEDNIHIFEYTVTSNGNTITITIHSDEEEEYTVANLLNSNE